MAQGLELGLEKHGLYEQFTLDLWVIFTLKVQGDSRSIVSLIHTELKRAEDRCVRGPATFHELYREHQGRLVDHQLLLNRRVNHPERAKSMLEVGEHVRRWEAYLTEWELLNETRMSDIQKAGTLMSLLPQSFENQVALHPNLELDPRTLRAYILNQAARARSRNATGNVKSIGPPPAEPRRARAWTTFRKRTATTRMLRC